MANVSVVCFLASYVVAFGLELTRLFRLMSISRAAMLLAGLVGLVAHTIYLLNRAGQTGMPPLLSSTHDWMLVLAWLAIVFYLFLSTVDRDLSVGLLLLPLVLVLIGSAYWVSYAPNSVVALNEDAVQESVIQNWVMIHVSLLVFGIADVLLAFVLSLMYVWQHHRLKHKRTIRGGLALPSLEKLARLNWWAVIVSVPLLTLGMGVGVGLGLYLQKKAVEISFADPVIVGYGMIWLALMGFFIWLCLKRRSTGKHVAWMTIWSFGFLLVTLIGLQVLSGENLPFESWKTWHTEVQRAVPAMRV